MRAALGDLENVGPKSVTEGLGAGPQIIGGDEGRRRRDIVRALRAVVSRGRLARELQDMDSSVEGLTDVNVGNWVDILVARRSSLGLSVADVAKAMRVSEAAVIELEGCDDNVSLLMLERYALTVGSQRAGGIFNPSA